MGQLCFSSDGTSEKCGDFGTIADTTNTCAERVRRGLRSKTAEFFEIEQTPMADLSHNVCSSDKTVRTDRERSVVRMEVAQGSDVPSRLCHEEFKTFPSGFPTTSPILTLYSCEKANMPNLLVAGAEDGSIVLVDYLKGHVSRRWPEAHTRDVNCLTRPSENGFFASASRDKLVKVWSVQSEQPRCELRGHKVNVTSLTSSPDGNFLVSGSRDNTVRLWDVVKGIELDCCDIKLNIVHFVHWIPDLQCVAQGGEDLAVRLWDIRMGSSRKVLGLSLKTTLTTFDYHPVCCDLVPDRTGCTLLTGHNGFNGHGGYIVEWDLRMPNQVRTFYAHSATVRALKCCSFPMSEPSEHFVSSSDDCALAVVSRKIQDNNKTDVSVGSLDIYEAPGGRIMSLDSCENNDILASTWSGAVVVFRPTHSKPLGQFRFIGNGGPAQ